MLYNKIQDNINIWLATEKDYNYVKFLSNRFGKDARHFMFIPDETMRTEIRRGNIICFDYNVLEAGYVYLSSTKGRARINQVAVDEQLWRDKVGSTVVKWVEDYLYRTGKWSMYLICNSNTMGHNFWSDKDKGYTEVGRKKAGGRGGFNVVWAKVLNTDSLLIKPSVYDIYNLDKYKLMYSMNDKKNIKKDNQLEFIFNNKR